MSTGFSLTNYGKISKEQWEEEVKKTLPEEQFQSLMHFKEEGFSINALYTSEETKRLSYLEKYHHKLPNHEDQRTWHVIANWESEQQTINAFTYGCRGLKIDIDDIFDLPENLILKLKGKFI